MSGVAGQYFLSITIEEQDIFANHSNTRINIINNMHQNLPVLDLGYTDSSGIMDSFQLGDGSPVNIKIGIEGLHVYDLSFIMQGSSKVDPTESSINYSLKAVLAHPEMLRKIVDEPFKGTSSALMQKLSSQAGLKFEGDASQDTMTWLPNRLPLASAAKKYAEKAWAGSGTTFIQAIDDSGTYYYKDLNKLASASSSKTFSSVAEREEILMLAWSAQPKDHVYNNLDANGATSVGVDDQGKVVEENVVDMKTFGGDIGGAKMKNVIGKVGGRINHLPLLSGNTHENWNKSQHQNNRIKSQFSSDLILLVDKPTQVKMFEKVKVIPYNPATRVPVQRLVNDYIVTAFTRFISSGRYFEKITVTTNRG